MSRKHDPGPMTFVADSDAGLFEQLDCMINELAVLFKTEMISAGMTINIKRLLYRIHRGSQGYFSEKRKMLFEIRLPATT